LTHNLYPDNRKFMPLKQKPITFQTIKFVVQVFCM